MYRTISFDIGIKNMAYIITDFYEENNNNNENIPINNKKTFSIIDWNVLNLIEQNEIKQTEFCNCIKNVSNKKNELCKKKAKYKKGEKYYCDKHSKTCSFIIPTKNNAINTLKKMKIDDLINYCRNNFISIITDKMKKKDIVEIVEMFNKEKMLEPVKIIKNKNASETDLILIGRNMKTLLDKIPDLYKINNVIIENQISPIATRMKTIQGMLTQYFIILGIPVIEYVSSSNKLKGLENVIDNKSKYKEHKLNSVYHCNQFIEKNPPLIKWKDSLLSNKKDDLCDAFLQCIMWLKMKNSIDYDDNYLIIEK